MKKYGLATFVIGLVAVGTFGLHTLVSADPTGSSIEIETQKKTETKEQFFLSNGLQTDTSKTSILLSEVLGGGPSKDGIPALTNPSYVSVEEVGDLYQDASQGVLVEIDGDTRWISYDILYWHEIINDTIGETPVSVTFCPLCGSAIAFDRRVENQTLEFGVSGKLWQSNLLMYDKKTESLWSQIEGEAKVGEYTGTVLDTIESNVTFWEDVRDIPNLKVLSHDTGYDRAYGENPYGTYEEDKALYFPVDNTDTSLHPKTIMIAGQHKGIAFALERIPLLEEKNIELQLGGETVQVVVDGSRIFVLDINQEPIPTFNTMWFSWANHWQSENSVVWVGEKSVEAENKVKEEVLSATTDTEDSNIILTEYFSYGCSYCKTLHNELDAALKERPEVTLELKHFIVYEEYIPIHEGQVCAAQQGKGYEYHDVYFKQHYPSRNAQIANRIAGTIGLDTEKFSQCLGSDEPSQVIIQDTQQGSAIGVRGTPTLAVRSNEIPIQQFFGRNKKSIIEELDSLQK